MAVKTQNNDFDFVIWTRDFLFNLKQFWSRNFFCSIRYIFAHDSPQTSNKKEQQQSFFFLPLSIARGQKESKSDIDGIIFRKNIVKDRLVYYTFYLNGRNFTVVPPSILYS